MKKKIPCICENTFDIEYSEEIDLDNDRKYLDEIQDGTFLNFTCPACGKNNKPEFPLSVIWPSREKHFEVIPELDRGDFYRRKKQATEKGALPPETLIGYPELAERLTLILDDLDPVPVEAIKYHLQFKAEEQYPENEMEVWYFGVLTESGERNALEFHITGIKENEVAVMKVPLSVYERTLEDYKKNPKSEKYSGLRYRGYLSYKNTMRPETQK